MPADFDRIPTPSFELTGTYPRTPERQAIADELAEGMRLRHVEAINRETARMIQSVSMTETWERVDLFDLYSLATIPTYRRRPPGTPLLTNLH